jgi:hypothetical protein
MAARPAKPSEAPGQAAPAFVNETDLALGRFGGKVLFATDGEKENDSRIY